MQRLRTMWSDLIKEHQVLILMLFLALVLGIMFIFLVPPWQHYDEPTQFEYTWLIANSPGLPEVGDYDQPLRREIAASMIEHGFFRDMGFKPNLLSSTEQIWIGISQIGSKPLYYWLVAIPLRFIQSTDIAVQLYVLRLLSLVFYLVTIAAAYGLAAELTPLNHPLRWLLPLSILLLPSFVDIMTAVNDDVAATALFSLFLWSGARLMIRGFNWLRLLAILTLSLLCYFTKTTVMVAVVLAVIPLLFSVIHAGKKRYARIIITAAVITGFLLVFDFGFPRNWYQESGPTSSNAAVGENVPLGKKAFAFDVSTTSSSSRISQLIPDDGKNRNGKTTYTVGAWIWADHPVTARTPVLHTTNKKSSKQVEVDREPRFYTFAETVGAQARPYKVSLFPGSNFDEEQQTIHYDGVVVVEGDWDGEIPQFHDASGSSGLWGGMEFTNLIRNPSAEYSSLTFRSWVVEVILNVVPGNPGLSLGLIQDPAPLVSYYTSTIKLLLHTFWARFGWAQVTLVGYRPYAILGIFSLLGAAGAVFAFWRSRKRIRWEIFIFLGLAFVSIWGAALLRGITSHIDGGYFIPVARYAYPVIIPTMLILNIGWLEIIPWIEDHLKIPRRYQLWVLISLFVLLDLLSIYSINQFFSV